MDYSTCTQPPKDFKPTFEVAGCYCECDGKLLFLKRNPTKPWGNCWGIPAGKLEKMEAPKEAIIREVREEVGLEINDETLQMLGPLYCRLPEFDYLFHVFYKPFTELPLIQLGLDEHLEAKWVTFREALDLPLIIGGKDALYFYKKTIQDFQ